MERLGGCWGRTGEEVGGAPGGLRGARGSARGAQRPAGGRQPPPLGGQGERVGEITAGSGGVRVRWGNNGGGGRTNGGAGAAPRSPRPPQPSRAVPLQGPVLGFPGGYGSASPAYSSCFFLPGRLPRLGSCCCAWCRTLAKGGGEARRLARGQAHSSGLSSEQCSPPAARCSGQGISPEPKELAPSLGRESRF